MNPLLLFDMLRRAQAGQALTPGERAVLKQLQGAAISILVTAATAAFPYLSGQSVDWQNVLHVFLASLSTSILFALSKYFTAQGDALPATAIAAAPAASVPVAAPISTAPAPAPAPLSGGEDWPRLPTNPMLKNVPLPRSQRSVSNVRH